MRPLLPLLSLLLLLPSLPHAFSLKAFRTCLPAAIPLHLPSSPRFAFLKSESFVNTRTPLLISTPTAESQVSALIKCARRASLRVCPRSGGHSFLAASLCRGLVIDLQNLRSVTLQSAATVANIQAGANMGELLWALWNPRRRWLAAGVCPSVGVGGYIFGGGHGPYEGRLGLACDSLLSVRIVDRFGKVLVASKTQRPALFWALCGAGGGQFGVVTSFRMRTVPSKPFDRAVNFRFRWPQKRVGELMHKWMDYGEMKGDVWFRMEMYLAKSDELGMTGYGSCYDVSSTDECLARLKKAAFFNTPGRETVHLSKAKNALDVHAFFGPDGDWGRMRAPNIRKAMLEQRRKMNGDANDRVYQSTFLKKKIKGKPRPSVQFWQKYADFCANPGRESIPWIVCELNLFNNAIDRKINNAFPHRGADIITHYIVGGGTAQDKKFVYNWMKNHLKPYTTGVYVNYPELQLKKTYAKAYWGKSLPRLKRIKRIYDPKLFFMNPQPIPRT